MRQMLTSWTSLYAALRRGFPAEHYHQGAELVSFEQDERSVTARFADGREEFPEAREATGDLLIAADGGGSTVRRILLPELNRNTPATSPGAASSKSATSRRRRPRCSPSASPSSNTQTRTFSNTSCPARMSR
jgi:2-polyprenyl-6-methoxyphenol hydroxylase-like FAD-dependent oxidoreductase